MCILETSDKGFGYHNEIHVWIKKEDYENANLMILLSYIILGHSDWKNAEIKIFAAVDKNKYDAEKKSLIDLTVSGRLPISPNNIIVIPIDDNIDRMAMINERSKSADLTIVGFHESNVKAKGTDVFNKYPNLGNVLYVNTLKSKKIE